MAKLSKFKIYKEACLHDRPLVYLRALRIYIKDAKVRAMSLFIEDNSRISDSCSYSKDKLTEDTFDYYASYWTPNIWKPVSKEYKSVAKKEEAYMCQCIDADCNDCFFFERGKEAAKGSNYGFCKKKEITTISNVNFCSNRDCFEHRNDKKND